MRIRWCPQRTNRMIEYSFEGETITAIVDGVSEAYDFAQMPDGVLEQLPDTLLPIRVLLGAERKDGELHVTLLRVVGPRPSDPAELAEWMSLWSDTEEVIE